MRQRREKNPGTFNESNKRSRRKYPEAERQRCKKYYEANKDALRVYKREWARENRDPEKDSERARRYRARNKDKVAESGKRWYEKVKQNGSFWPQRWRENASRRRAAMETEDCTEVVIQMYDDQQGLCAYCEAPLFGNYHVDHMLPLSKGGEHRWSNLAITCPHCNLSKGVQAAEEFMERLAKGAA